MPSPPAPAAAAASAAETAYVASLFAYLQGKPHVLLSQLGHDVVPKPDGVPRLCAVLRSREWPHLSQMLFVLLAADLPIRRMGRWGGGLFFSLFVSFR